MRQGASSLVGDDSSPPLDTFFINSCHSIKNNTPLGIQIMREFIEGMHKVGEALSAAISAQVTKDAQLKHEAEINKDKQPEMAPR
jgi:hypothetical protein